MSMPAPPPHAPASGPADTLENALRGWVAPALPDAGFTPQVMLRVARWRHRPGLQAADAWAQLQQHQRRTARQARLTGLGLALGLAAAAAWLLALGPGTGALVLLTGPWAPVLASALGGLAGATAWLTLWSD